MVLGSPAPAAWDAQAQAFRQISASFAASTFSFLVGWRFQLSMEIIRSLGCVGCL